MPPMFGDHELRIMYAGGEIRMVVPDGFTIVYYAARIGIEEKRGVREFGSSVYEDQEL
jgi:hypothetical protein